MSSSLADTLAALARAFERLGIDWYLFGAQVPCREDLICMKLLAGRPHDLQDAEAMAKIGNVDIDEIRTFVEGMAQALGDQGILSSFATFLAGLR